MLCEKNRYRGTPFEYELMHNFHYFFYVLLPLSPHALFTAQTPAPPPPPISTPARRITRKEYDIGWECSQVLFVFYILFFSLLFRSAEGWMGVSCSERTDGELRHLYHPFPILSIKLFSELSALSELKQPERRDTDL
jgi:hypothetical protein